MVPHSRGLNIRKSLEKIQHTEICLHIQVKTNFEFRLQHLFFFSIRTDRVKLMKTYQNVDKKDNFKRAAYGTLVETHFNTGII